MVIFANRSNISKESSKGDLSRERSMCTPFREKRLLPKVASKFKLASDQMIMLLSVLKRKHDDINIDYGELFEFYKKLTSKIDGYKNNLHLLNIKVKIID